MSNNTATPLISLGTFTGTYQKAAVGSAVIQVNVFSDTSGLLHIQQSANGVFTQNDKSFVYDTVGTAKIFETPLALAYFRITYTNTSGRTQSYLYIQSIDRTIPATDIDIRFLSGQTDSALMFAFDPQTGVKVPLHCDSSGNLGISANVSVSLDHTSDSVAVWGAQANGTQQALLTDASGRLLVVTDSGPGDVTNISGQVEVVNLQDLSGLFVTVTNPSSSVTADISGQTVLVGNFPATQVISGDVSVSNFPALQEISGNVQVMNLLDLSGIHVVVENPATSVTADISGQTVLVGNFPSTQAVSGTVSVDNFPALQEISGNVQVMNLLDLSGLHVIVDNPVTAVTADISGQTVLIGNYPATQAVSGTVSVDNFPALQEISGNVAVMNWGDASGLYVTVTNPSSSVTADISGQTVVINANAYSSSMFLTGNVTQVQYNQIYGTITGNPANDTRFLTEVTAGDKFYIYKDYQLLFLGTVQIVFTNYQLQLVDLDNGIFVGSFPYTNQLQYTKQVPSLDFDNNTLVNITNKVLTTTGTITGQVSALCTVTNFPAPVVDVSATIVNWLDASGLHVYVNDPVTSITADISGQTVLVGNFPATQVVSGDVSVSNFPALQEISGNVAVMNLLDLSGLHVIVDNPVTAVTADISGDTVLVGNFPATQAVSGTVSVDNFPALQEISGNVQVMNLLDLSGLHVVVENPITSVTADISGQTVLVGNFPATQVVSGDVSVSNFPALQEISGNVQVMNLLDLSGLHVVVENPITSVTADISGQTVLVGNFPATQVVSGDVSVSNFPALQEISGNVAVMNLLDLSGIHVVVENPVTSVSADISGQTVLVGNFPATQVVSGDVSVSNFPALQEISGNVAVMNLLDLSGIHVVVENPVTSVSADISGQTVLVGNFPATQVVSGDVSVSNFPALQEISGNVAVMNLLDLSGLHVVVENPITSVSADISGQTVLIGNFPATQVVSGTVSVDNFPALQEISGNVQVMNLLDLSGLHVVVENPITSVSADISGQTVLIGNFPATQVVSGDVSVSNFPALQEISGNVAVMNLLDLSGIHVVVENPITSVTADISGQTVLVGNFPATQVVSGDVSVSNFPALQEISGNVAVMNLLDLSGIHVVVENPITSVTADISGQTVLVGNFPATQVVSGDVSVSNFPALQEISGNVAVMNLLDLSGIHVVVENPITSVTADISGQTVLVGNFPATQVVSGDVSVSNFPALQEISGNVAVMNLLDLSGLHVVVENPITSVTADISGQTVLIGNFPATQVVSGDVSVSNFPALQEISGNVAVMNLLDLSGIHVVVENPITSVTADISGQTVLVGNFPATQVVSGDVSVSNFPALQEISGNVAVMNLLDLSGIHVVVENPITSVSADISGQTVLIGNFPATQVVSGDVSVSNFPAVQDISGTVITSATNSSMVMYGSGYEPNNYLMGVAKITNTDVSGIATQFLSQVAEGDNFWIINIFETPVFIGVVASIQSNTQLTLVASAGLTYSYDYYRIVLNLVEGNVPLQLTPVGGNLRTYVSGGFVTESNSADILTEVTSINGKITTCNTSDISGSVNLYALKPTPTYTQLAGEFLFQAYNSFCDGSGTAFLSELAEGDLVYYVPNIGEPAVLLGTVLSIVEDVGMFLTGTTISSTLITNYGLTVTTPLPTALVTHTGTDFLSVQVENTITEVNSAAILADVSGINGKITACNTSDISGSVNLYALKTTSTFTYTPSPGTISLYTEYGYFVCLGTGTQFQTDFAVDDTVYYLPAEGEPAVALGVVLDAVAQNYMILSGVTIAVPTIIDFYGTGVTTYATAPAPLVTHPDTNFLSVQVEGATDISGIVVTSATNSSMTMYASGFEQPVTILTGKIAEISGTYVTGEGTLFVTDVAIGDNFWIVINGIPQLWGVVYERPTDTFLILVTSFGNLPNNDTNYYFAVNLVEINTPLLLDAYGDLRVNLVNKLIDVAVSGTVAVNVNDPLPAGTNSIGTVDISGQTVKVDISGQTVVLGSSSNTIGKVYSDAISASIITLFDVSAGTSHTISANPVTLTSWSPTNLGNGSDFAYYKFYNKVGATASDTPIFTYPIHNNNTIAPIPLYNLKFTTACSVRATHNFTANDTTIPNGIQISNFLYSSL